MMLRTCSVTALALMMLFVSGCKNESESAISDMLSKHKELISILKTVKDKASALTAKTKIDALAADVKALGSKYANKRASDTEMKNALAKYKPEMDQSEKDITAEMERISKIPDAIEPVAQAVMGLGQSWMSIAGK